MTIGILETGGPPDTLADRYEHGYGHMVRELLGADVPTLVYDIRGGELPPSVDACTGWVVTGSAAGVYDVDPWIAPLKGFLQTASSGAPIVGICFGHQIMAEAFGGKVIKSPKGWGVGLHRYDIAAAQPWMDSDAPIRLPVSHQDQVVETGPGAIVVGGNAFTPYGFLAYPERNAVSLQAHPEFAPEYTRALIETRRGSRIDAAFADQAIASLRQPNDNARVGGWLKRFLGVAG